MTTVIIHDIPAIDDLTQEDARQVVGGRIKQREGVEPKQPEPGGGMGYTGIMIEYTLTVIE